MTTTNAPRAVLRALVDLTREEREDEAGRIVAAFSAEEVEARSGLSSAEVEYGLSWLTTATATGGYATERPGRRYGVTARGMDAYLVLAALAPETLARDRSRVAAA